MEETNLGWSRPKEWCNNHISDFGNSYFYALEATCLKIVGYNPTIKRKNNQKDFFKINSARLLFNSVIDRGEAHTSSFLTNFKMTHNHLRLTIYDIFGSSSRLR